MRMFGRLFASDPQAPANRDPSSDYWYGPAEGSASSIVVSADTVQQIPEVYDCLQVIAQTIAALPFIVYRKGKNGSKERADEHPIADLLHHRASADHTAYEFRHQMTWDLLLHRNAFAEIIGGRRGPIDQLVRLDPAKIWVIKGIEGDGWSYEYRDGMTRRRLLRDDVFHLRAPPLTSDNILGRSLIKDGEMTFARALALQDYARRFFENDATPGGVVEVPGKFSPEQAREFQRKWQGQFSGRNRHKVATLDNGSKFNKLDVQNDKAQFIDTWREVALQCLRFWRMQPHKVGILDKATFSNIEQQSLEFVVDTLMPWLVTWEQGVRRDLIIRDRDFAAEHNVAGLLRGDIKARFEAYRIAREWGWLSANEIRALENMNPIANGDVYLQPLNMAPAGSDPAQRAAYSAQIERELALYSTQRKLIEVKG